MRIENPVFKLKENNIFTIREKEFSELEKSAYDIVKVVEDYEFSIKEFGLREPKFTSGELCRTSRKTLVIKLQKGVTELDLSVQIPKLVDGNYIIINGRKKVPQFQLYSIPLITKGNSIKLRSNVLVLNVTESKNSPWLKLYAMGKDIPLSLITFAFFGKEKTIEKFPFNDIEYSENMSLYEKFLLDLKSFYEEHKDTDEEEIFKMIGRYYSKRFNITSKGKDLIYALELFMKVDLLCSRFIKSETLIEEIAEILKNPDYYDETNLENRRIRCFEYLVISHISKIIFDLCLANRKSKNAKFNVNSTQILSDCNVSDIVQFDFSINPIDELTKLSRTSLVGPGGFSRENVPEYLRDISPSMFGRLCPVDTPDRDNCGVLQNLIPNSILDENLKFTDETIEKQPISAPVSMVPFSEHDDQTRLQMSSSQMRQAIMLKNFDKPLIQSGCEGLYTNYTQFVKTAKKNGEVVYIDRSYIIVKYTDNTSDIFDISYRKIYVENLDMLKIYVKVGDKFKRGDILAESNFCSDGKINIGKNLLTAVMVYYGYNYEDGIVISDRLVKDSSFTSVHYIDLSFVIPPDKVLVTLEDGVYKPLPDLFKPIRIGERYAILKEVPLNISDYCTIFEEYIEMYAKKDIMMLTECNIYANTWNIDIPEFNDWVQDKILKQKIEEEKFKETLYQYFDRDYADQYVKDNCLDKFSHDGKYKMKSEKINGIYVEMFGMYTRPIKLGDKIGNRHGNKGVISRIAPQNEMPQLEDGRHTDVCINPLGIISRMNIGQLFELALAMSLSDLIKNLVDRIENGVPQDELKDYLLKYISLVDNTDGNWYSEQFENNLPEILTKEFAEDLCLIQAPFESTTINMIFDAMDYTNTKFDYKLFDPVSKSYIKNRVAVGNIYFFRMVHIADSRLAARGIGSYTKRTLQPSAGRKNSGGQRQGEMETGCLIAHDALKNLHESLTVKSDCVDLKNKYIRDKMETDLIKEEELNDEVPESVKMMEAYHLVLGVEM